MKGSLNSSDNPNIFPVVFLIDFLSSGGCIISKYGGKQVVFMFISTPALYTRQKWQWADSPTREISRSPGSGSNPATPNSAYKEINKDIIKPSLSLNDYSHKCFNHHSLGTQLCVFVCVGGCVRPSCDVRLVSAQHRWVYLAARRACNLPTFIPLFSLFLPPSRVLFF